MKATGLTEWLAILLWAAAPFLTGVFAVLLFATPVQLFDMAVPMPLFPFMVVFYWAMLRPNLMPPLAIFLIGLFQDFLSGGPVGLWALSYLLAAALISTQRGIFAWRGRAALWAGFAIAAILVAAISWLAARLALGTAPSGGALFSETLATIVAFALVMPLLDAIRHVTRQARRLTVHSTMAGGQ